MDKVDRLRQIPDMFKGVLLLSVILLTLAQAEEMRDIPNPWNEMQIHVSFKQLALKGFRL